VRRVEFVFIYSGQHYNHEMSRIFLDELELPKPHESLVFKNSNPATRVREMIIELERALGSYWSRRSRIMLIQRNTNHYVCCRAYSFDLKMLTTHMF